MHLSRPRTTSEAIILPSTAQATSVSEIRADIPRIAQKYISVSARIVSIKEFIRANPLHFSAQPGIALEALIPAGVILPSAWHFVMTT
jgi:hypothetical protein